MTEEPVAYLIASSAPPVRQLAEPLALLQEAGWSACVILTPTAATWLDVEDLETRSGFPVRIQPRLPDEQDPLPKADAVLAAPMTFNSINKFAGGISDTLAVSLLNELLGAGVPIVMAPCVKSVLRQHPAYGASIDLLVASGVYLLDPDRITTRGADGLAIFAWDEVITGFLSDIRD